MLAAIFAYLAAALAFLLAAVTTTVTTFDYVPLLQSIVQLAVIVLLAFTPTAIRWFMEKTGISALIARLGEAKAQEIDGKIRDYVGTILANGIAGAKAYADEKITKIGTVDVGNPYVAYAGNYLLAHAKDGVDHFAMDDAAVARFAANVMARVALDLVANATPPGAKP